MPQPTNNPNTSVGIMRRAAKLVRAKSGHTNNKSRPTTTRLSSTKKPHSKKNPKHEIYLLDSEYANIPKTSHDLPQRLMGESFEEYLRRVQSGLV